MGLSHTIRFLIATLRHKWFVYEAGRRLGVGRWQLLVHDLSKLRPSECVPYGRFFYAPKPAPDAGADPAMRLAWLRHVQRNPHHWQHWVVVNGASIVARRTARDGDAGLVEALPMPERYVREMLADWLGVSRAYHGLYPESRETWTWWQQNKDQMVLHSASRAMLEAAIADWFGQSPAAMPGS